MKILVVSPAFAPLGLIGAARMTSLVSYLIAKGDEVTVISIKSENFTNSPEMLQRNIPSGMYKHVIVNTSINEEEGYTHFAEETEVLLKEREYDIILCSVGPWHSFYFIPSLAKKYGIPYIIDKRDSWIYDHHISSGIAAFFKHTIADFLLRSRIERTVLKSAYSIVEVSEAALRQTVRRYPSVKPHIICIRNGFEDLDNGFQKQKNDWKQPERVFVVAGKFFDYSERLGKAVIDGFQSANDSGLECKLVHVGRIEESADDYCHRRQILNQVFEQIGPLSFSDTISLIKSSRCCVFTYRDKYAISTKIYDYIAMNKPIIGAYEKRHLYITTILEGFSGNYNCYNSKDVRCAIEQIIRNQVYELGCSHPSDYYRSTLNKKYYEYLHGIV